MRWEKMRMIRRWNSTAITVLFAAACAVATIGCQRTSGATTGGAEARSIERGRYLVTVMGCGDCHTPLKLGANGPEPDLTRDLSGHPEEFTLGPPPTLGPGGWLWAGASSNTAFAGPWGVTYAPNLTPDEETGIGVWTEEMFIDAIRQGKMFGSGRPINPPMPWPAYGHASDDDLGAMFAYLKSLPPIKNHVPDWQPPAAP